MRVSRFPTHRDASLVHVSSTRSWLVEAWDSRLKLVPADVYLRKSVGRSMWLEACAAWKLATWVTGLLWIQSLYSCKFPQLFTDRRRFCRKFGAKQKLLQRISRSGSSDESLNWADCGYSYRRYNYRRQIYVYRNTIEKKFTNIRMS